VTTSASIYIAILLESLAWEHIEASVKQRICVAYLWVAEEEEEKLQRETLPRQQSNTDTFLDTHACSSCPAQESAHQQIRDALLRNVCIGNVDAVPVSRFQTDLISSSMGCRWVLVMVLRRAVIEHVLYCSVTTVL
jgi:hypothetical protein